MTIRLLLCSLAAGLFCAPVTAQDDERRSPDDRYVFKRDHDPNGIGKFYMGREIAYVMGFGFNGSGAR